VIYSLAASCKLCGIHPFAYLRDILTQINAHPAGRIEGLLPGNWNPSGLQSGFLHAANRTPNQNLNIQSVHSMYSAGRLHALRL